MELTLLRPLLSGLSVTLGLTLAASIAACLLALPLCMARIGRAPFASAPASVVIAVLRNTPLLLQLLFWYFGVSQWLPAAFRRWLLSTDDGIWPTYETLVALVGLAVYSAAFIAEELRAGLAAVPSGQRRAAVALGLTPSQIWRHIVLPQAWRIVRQPLTGQWMNIAKNSSLAMAIGVAELAYNTRQVESQTFRSFEVYAWSTLLYVLVALAIGGYGHWRGRHDALRMQVR